MTGDVFAPSINLDRNSPVPLYFQIAEPIAQLILSRQLETGTRIEDELSMAKRLKVSRPTARRALQRLVDQGLVVRRRGVGTQVAPQLIHRPSELTSLLGDLAQSGFHATTQVLDYTQRLADAADAALLGIPEDTPVIETRRLRLADGEPIALMRNLLPARLSPSRDELEATGLYEGLRQRNVQLLSARQSIGARNATPDEARLLRMKRGASLLTMRRTTIDDAGAIVEYGDHIYRADRYTFDSTVFAS
ncbi:MAG: GntR family transcriptional regulator [Propionibacterium sp.]|nr:GntR family transcriptional regulator [Propionibacterium sp.]